MTAPSPTLERRLGSLDATALVVGSMIGSGIFIVSAESARLVGSPGWLLVAWALAGLMTITGALSCAELAAMFPSAGGQYVFLREAYGPAVAFLFGWALLLVFQSGTIAAVAVAFGNFLGVLVPAISSDRFLVRPIVLGHYAFSLSTQQAAAIASILLLTHLHTRGLAVGRAIQNTLTAIKTTALLGLIVLGLVLGWNASSAAVASPWWHSAAVPAGGLAFALVLGRATVGPLFAQTAWTNVTFIGEEVRDPGRTLPRALARGCIIVVGLYLLANVAYVVTLPLDTIQHAPGNRVGTATMAAILGPAGTVLMAAAIVISTFGANNGLTLAGARVSYAMARDGLFFSRIGRLNARHVPAAALWAQGIWASLLTLPRTAAVDPTTGAVTFGNVYSQLIEYIVPADLALCGLMVAAVVVLRRRSPDAARPYRTWGYPAVPILYVLLAACLILDLGYVAPATSGIGYAIVLAGVPAYVMWRRRARRVLV
ncbi:MAG TPA: amino acid permease [Candidatus Polarisedimenticolaceae bacterium]|nr:amino acid permease [Candidatus Polarisedimenticolaceae bacterium]